MHGCPCGHLGDKTKECICTPLQIQKYRGRISGPLLDRIDIHVDVPRISKEELLNSPNAEPSAKIKKRIEAARLIQSNRFSNFANKFNKKASLTNSQMKSKEVKHLCKLSSDAKDLLAISIDKLGLSGRSYERVLKVSRTIADLESNDTITVEHIAEAIQYRSLDRSIM